MQEAWARSLGRQRAWEEEMVFLPGESRGQSSLAGHHPWSHERVGRDLEMKRGQLEAAYSTFASLSVPIYNME